MIHVAADKIITKIEDLELTVQKWGPKSTRVGVIPNIQPGNKAGIWMKVDAEQGFGEVQLIFDGEPAELTRFTGQSITAAISADKFNTPGVKQVSIKQLLTGRQISVGTFLITED